MRTISLARLSVLAAVVALAQGCAVGQKVNYGDAAMFSVNVSAKNIALGVQDRRPYVLNRDKTPDFVGLSRGGFGNPFDVNTASGRPLADEVADLVARSLRQRGASVDVVNVPVLDSPENARKRLLAGSAARALHITIAEWKSDSFMGTGLSYDLLAIGYDAAGRKLGEHRVNGEDNLGGSSGIHSARDRLPGELAKKVEQLLNDARLDGVLR